MKRLILIFGLLLLISAGTYSQEKNNFRNIKIGLLAAPNLSWIKSSSDSIAGNGSRLGFNYGLMTEFYFTENYGISTGVNISYNGGKIQDKEHTSGFVYNKKYKLQYIEIPVCLKMKTKEYGYISYFGQFGFGASYNMKSRADYETIDDKNRNTYPDKIDINVTDKDISKFRGSFIVGLGIEKSLLGNTKAIAGLFFNNGITDIFKGDHSKGMNNYLSINLGVIF
jgi:hypothetical protein